MSTRLERLEAYRATGRHPAKPRTNQLARDLIKRLEVLENRESAREALGLPFTSIVRSFGWWGGALGLSEILRGITWHTIPAVREVPIITAAQNTLSWVVGCAVGASVLEKIVTPLGHKLEKIRAGRT